LYRAILHGLEEGAALNLRLYVLIAGLALYGASLFFPAVIFKPDVRSNPNSVNAPLP
jgi:hypothetical protein